MTMPRHDPYHLRFAITLPFLTLLASCATTPPPAALDNHHEQVFLTDRITDDLLHDAFSQLLELERRGENGSVDGEALATRIHAYLRLAGDARFATVLAQEPPVIRPLVARCVDVRHIAPDYPLTHALLVTKAR